MILFLIVLLCLSVTACHGPITCWPPVTNHWVTWNAGAAEKHCREYTFPEPSSSVFSSAAYYGIRKLAIGNENYLLVTATEGGFTSRQFKIRLDAMDRFVPATDIEWRQAQEYGRSELFGSWDSDFNVKLSKQDKATMYAYRGKFRWGATESPSRRWVAIQSLDGILPERRGTILFDFQRSEGDHHLEVFEAASRRRIFRLDGQFCQVDPDSIWRPPSGWITEDILLVTFHERRLKTVILCRVP